MVGREAGLAEEDELVFGDAGFACRLEGVDVDAVEHFAEIGASAGEAAQRPLMEEAREERREDVVLHAAEFVVERPPQDKAVVSAMEVPGEVVAGRCEVLWLEGRDGVKELRDGAFWEEDAAMGFPVAAEVGLQAARGGDAADVGSGVDDAVSGADGLGHARGIEEAVAFHAAFVEGGVHDHFAIRGLVVFIGKGEVAAVVAEAEIVGADVLPPPVLDGEFGEVGLVAREAVTGVVTGEDGVRVVVVVRAAAHGEVDGVRDGDGGDVDAAGDEDAGRLAAGRGGLEPANFRGGDACEFEMTMAGTGDAFARREDEEDVVALLRQGGDALEGRLALASSVEENVTDGREVRCERFFGALPVEDDAWPRRLGGEPVNGFFWEHGKGLAFFVVYFCSHPRKDTACGLS